MEFEGCYYRCLYTLMILTFDNLDSNYSFISTKIVVFEIDKKPKSTSLLLRKDGSKTQICGVETVVCCKEKFRKMCITIENEICF